MSTAWTGRTADWVSPPISEVSGLAEQLRAQGADPIDLGQAILGLPPPSRVLDGVRFYLESAGPHAYSPDPGIPELRGALAGMLRTKKRIAHARGEDVMVTCGANQAFANVLLSVTQTGDEVITFGPGYFDHGYTICLAGCDEVQVPLSIVSDRYTFSFDAVLRALTDRTRAIVLVSPGNPTGAVASQSFVEDLCDLCAKRGLWLISDETYDLLTFDGAIHHSPASISGDDRVVVIGTFSKILGMAGWRVGYYHGSQQLMEESYKVQDALVVCAPVPSQRAALAALDDLDAYVDEARRALRERRDALVDALEAWGRVDVRIPEGATFLLASIRGGGDDIAFCKRLLRDTGVVSVPGSAFGPHGRGSIRLSFGNQAVDRIVEAGRRLRGQL